MRLTADNVWPRTDSRRTDAKVHRYRTQLMPCLNHFLNPFDSTHMCQSDMPVNVHSAELLEKQGWLEPPGSLMKLLIDKPANAVCPSICRREMSFGQLVACAMRTKQVPENRRYGRCKNPCARRTLRFYIIGYVCKDRISKT